jgi:hypothetical protein
MVKSTADQIRSYTDSDRLKSFFVSPTSTMATYKHGKIDINLAGDVMIG